MEFNIGIAEENKSMGTPRVGGPYSLIDHDGKPVTQETYAGKHTLVRLRKRLIEIYFGFTRCPDICPEELDKMAHIIDAVNEKGRNKVMQPLFITCDPARDDPAALKKYLAGIIL
jgi:protein SCO1/2